MQAIQKENLVVLQLYRFARDPAAFLETVNRFLNRLSIEQRAEMTIEQLDVEGFRSFVVAVIDPIGRMLDQRPKIVVEVEHQKTQTLLLEPFRELDRRGGFAGGTGTTDPNHPETVSRFEPCQDFGRSFVQ